MLWNSLVCQYYLNLKSLLWKVYDSKLDNGTFDFIKILAQIINIFSKVWPKNIIFNLWKNGKSTMVCEGLCQKQVNTLEILF
jgi:hypothetical protein